MTACAAISGHMPPRSQSVGACQLLGWRVPIGECPHDKRDRRKRHQEAARGAVLRETHHPRQQRQSKARGELNLPMRPKRHHSLERERIVSDGRQRQIRGREHIRQTRGLGRKCQQAWGQRGCQDCAVIHQAVAQRRKCFVHRVCSSLRARPEEHFSGQDGVCS